MKVEKEWKEIKDYPGYFVSNYGEVYSKKTNKILSQSTTKKVNGYKLVWRSQMKSKPYGWSDFKSRTDCVNAMQRGMSNELCS